MRTIEELEALRRRMRRLVIGAGIATSILLGTALFLVRRTDPGPGRWVFENIEMAQHRMGH